MANHKPLSRWTDDEKRAAVKRAFVATARPDPRHTPSGTTHGDGLPPVPSQRRN